MAKYKIIAGPDKMYVSRLGINSEICEIGDELITSDSVKVRELYYSSVHENAKKVLRSVRDYRSVLWDILDQAVQEFLNNHQDKELFFDGPSWIISFVSWKQAKYGEWFIVDKKTRNRIRKYYTQRTEKG